MSAKVPVDRERLAEVCRRYHIRRLSLFGSVLRDDFRPDSDVDVLVEFEPRDRPGMVARHHLEGELSQVLGGRRVDLVNEKFLNWRIRDRVLTEAEEQFVEG
jgi:hypothetical protein